MSLADRLRALGERLGVFRAAPPAPGRPTAIQRRTVSFAELCGRAPTAPAAIWQEPRAIADAATTPGVAGWTAERAAAALAGLGAQPRDAARLALLEMIAADGGAPEDIVRDAVARDQALDAAAAATHAVLCAHAAARAKRTGEIAATIVALEAERSRLTQEQTADEARWQAWWAEKRAVEERLEGVVAHLVDGPVVSVDREAPTVGPTA